MSHTSCRSARPTMTRREAVAATGIDAPTLCNWIDEGMPMPRQRESVDGAILLHWAAWHRVREGGLRLAVQPPEAVAIGHAVLTGDKLQPTQESREAFAARVARLLAPWHSDLSAHRAAGFALGVLAALNLQAHLQGNGSGRNCSAAPAQRAEPQPTPTRPTGTANDGT